MTVLIDTSFLVALSNQKDKNHQAAQSLAQSKQFLGYMPDIAITELFFVIYKRISSLPKFNPAALILLRNPRHVF